MSRNEMIYKLEKWGYCYNWYKYTDKQIYFIYIKVAKALGVL